MEIRTIIVIGASTGGPQTLSKVIARLPLIDASVLIVQHMPKYINESIVRRLAELSRMKVKLGEEGECLENRTIYIAPSDVHMKLQNNRTIELVGGEKINYVRPAIDVTMESIKRGSGIKAIGVVLTGMGSDGMKGIRHIKNIGGTTIAQNENSCVIYGMPKAAVSTGMVDFILPPEEIGDKLTELVNPPVSAPV